MPEKLWVPTTPLSSLLPSFFDPLSISIGFQNFVNSYQMIVATFYYSGKLYDTFFAKSLLCALFQMVLFIVK